MAASMQMGSKLLSFAKTHFYFEGNADEDKRVVQADDCSIRCA